MKFIFHVKWDFLQFHVHWSHVIWESILWLFRKRLLLNSSVFIMIATHEYIEFHILKSVTYPEIFNWKTELGHTDYLEMIILKIESLMTNTKQLSITSAKSWNAWKMSAILKSIFQNFVYSHIIYLNALSCSPPKQKICPNLRFYLQIWIKIRSYLNNFTFIIRRFHKLGIFWQIVFLLNFLFGSNS